MASFDLIYPVPSQETDGIADHTRAVAAELASRGHRVRILCGERERHAGGVEYVNVWPDGRLGKTPALRRTIADGGADAVVLQFEQFAYGRRGFNPRFSGIFRAIAAASPGTTRILFAHETYVPPVSLRKSVMYVYQRWQLSRLVANANAVLVTCEAWRRRIEHLGGSARVVAGPSAIPVATDTPRSARAALGIGDELAVVVFGYLDDSRVGFMGSALRDPAFHGATFLYAGKDGAAAERVGTAARKSIVLASPSAEHVSRALTAADLGLAPFHDGASARRSSLAAMLGHGLPTVSTATTETDPYLRELADAGALALSEGDEDSFVSTAAALAASAPARAAMRAALAAEAASLPSWGSVADAIESAVRV